MFLVLVLLSAPVKRFSVSHMWFFVCSFCNFSVFKSQCPSVVCQCVCLCHYKKKCVPVDWRLMIKIIIIQFSTFCHFLSVLVLMLLFAHVKRFSVSSMQDVCLQRFFVLNYISYLAQNLSSVSYALWKVCFFLKISCTWNQSVISLALMPRETGDRETHHGAKLG